MRRADRLFTLVQLIRGRRLTTAAFLARQLQVSARTVYRDVADLQYQGVPIQGEAGVGYRLGAGFDLPPLMFTEAEARALVASIRLAQAWLDPALAADAQAAWGKVLSVLPAAAQAAAESLPVYAPVIAADAGLQKKLQRIREAVQSRQKLQASYCDLYGRQTQCVLLPLGCFYWGAVWTLAAWCESRQGFRSFRMDRITSVSVLDAQFEHADGRTLADFMRSVKHVNPHYYQINSNHCGNCRAAGTSYS